ncbi:MULTISPECIES: hypothetical protein [unclassified Sphingomonas]|uniref:hypothetical protein n=1 Tax=unclassified Sphingomonas TaxID=196159 RepID=UPI0008321492|nr:MULTISPECIES: hypothetical protein [unclassified Sphingomonas]
MAMRRREFWKYAEERWPLLHNLMVVHFNEDFNIDFGSLEGAMRAATAGGSVEHRKAIIREWRDWNASEGIKDDVRPFLHDGFGVAVLLRKPIDGRNFMNRVYDELIAGVRAEVGKAWE